MASSSAPSTQCLSDAEVADFARGTLSVARRSSAAEHLLTCAACAARVEKARHLPPPDLHKAQTQVEVTSAMEVNLNSKSGQSHWTDGSLNVEAVADSTPSAPSVSLDDFLTGLSQSGLLPPSEVANVRDKSNKDPAFSTVAGLIQWLVQEHKLTRYQAEILARGQKGGLVLGNYIILEKLGQGGMGTVFKARHRRMNRLVALKVLPQSLSSVPEAILRFQREVEAAARLHHPNIAAAFDADEASGVHFLVMEYVEGPNLANYVKLRGALPLSVAVRLMEQAARGLTTAHGQGVVHRDIKPSNLMVNQQGMLKILDMGLAQLRGGEANLELTSDVTQTGRVMGTVDYMAPEQARDAKNVDFRADIYSLGCTLFYLVAGKTPAPPGSAAEKLLWHQTQSPPPLSAICPQSSQRLDTLVLSMMAKKPDERPESMEHIADELAQCALDLPPADTSSLFDGLQLVREQGPSAAFASNYGQQTRGGTFGDTLVSQAGRSALLRAAAPPRKSRAIIYACGIGGLLVLAILLAAPFFGRVPAPAGHSDEKNDATADAARVATNSKPSEKLPAPLPSPHAEYEKLLTWVFRNHGKVTAVSGKGEQFHLTSLTSLPNEPLDISSIQLDGTGVQDSELAMLLTAPALRELSLANTRISDQGLAQLASLRQLSHLNLAKTGITSAGMAHLARLADLVELNLEGTRLTDAGLPRLTALGNLERLLLSDTSVSDVGIEQLKGLRSLKTLTLNGTPLSEPIYAALKAARPGLEIAWDGTDLERAVAVRLLDKHATLTVVDRSGQRHEGVKSADSLPPGRVTVKVVNLSTGTNFIDDDFKQLALLPEVETISLGGIKVSREGLASLHGLSSLTTLDLGTPSLSPAAVEALRKALPKCRIVIREPADVDVARLVCKAGGRVTVVTERNQLISDISDANALPPTGYSVRAIKLDDPAKMDDALLVKIGELPALEQLFLANPAINDAAIARIALCKSLQELTVSGTQITAAGVASLSQLPKLSRLYLANTQIASDGVRRLGDVPTLTHLSLQGVTVADDDLALFKRLVQLEWLDLSSTPLTDKALVHLARFTKLRELHIERTKVTDAGREELAAQLGANCRIVGDPLDPQRLAARWLVEHSATVSLESGRLGHVRELPRSGCRVLAIDLAELPQIKREQVVPYLTSCTDAVSLNLSSTRLLESDLAFLRTMPALREVRLANLPLSDKTLELLSDHPNLEIVDLSGTRVTGQGLRQLAAATGLKQLLLGNTLVEDRHFSALEGFPKLESLDISATSTVTDAALDAIARLTELKILGLRRAKITDAALEKIASLSNLEQIDLGDVKIGDAGIGKLVGLAKLRQISLANTQVTEGVTSTLSQMKQLKSINLSRTKISPESVKQLQTDLPGCAVIASTVVPREPNNAAGNNPTGSNTFGPPNGEFRGGRSP